MSETINMKNIGEIVAQIETLNTEKDKLVVGSHAWFWYKGRIQELKWVLYGDSKRYIWSADQEED